MTYKHTVQPVFHCDIHRAPCIFQLYPPPNTIHSLTHTPQRERERERFHVQQSRLCLISSPTQIISTLVVLWAGLIHFPPQNPSAWETRKTWVQKKEETKEQKCPKITNVLGWIWWRRLFAAVGTDWVCARSEFGSATLPRSHCSSESEDQSAGKSGWDKRPSGEHKTKINNI